MKQSARESFTRSRCVIDVAAQSLVQIIDLTCAIRQPLARIPAGVKFAGTENGFRAVGHRQLRIENCAADFQMRIERFARDEQTHDFARAFEDCVYPAISQKSFHSNRRLASSGERLRSLI